MASPSGRRGARSSLGPLVLGLLLGGITSALGFWLVSGLLRPVWPPVRIGLLVVVALAALADDLFGLRWTWPQNPRQVPQAIRHRAPRTAMLQFGFELGTGLRTFVTAKAPYVLVSVVLLGGLSIVQALALGAGFGAGRALMPLTRTWHRATGDWDRRLERTSRWVKVTATALAGCAATWLAVAAV
jgi:hypothetical protein